MSPDEVKSLVQYVGKPICLIDLTLRCTIFVVCTKVGSNGIEFRFADGLHATMTPNRLGESGARQFFTNTSRYMWLPGKIPGVNCPSLVAPALVEVRRKIPKKTRALSPRQGGDGEHDKGKGVRRASATQTQARSKR